MPASAASDPSTVRAICDLDTYCDGLDYTTSHTLRLAGVELSMPIAPRFVVGGLPANLAQVMFSEIQTGPVTCRTLRDAAVTGDGIVVHGGTALSSIVLNHPAPHVRHIVDRLRLDRRTLAERRVNRRAVMMSAPGYTIWGHWLVDILPKLFVLHRAGFDIRALDYIVPMTLPRFAVELLGLAGIPTERLIGYDEESEILQVAELLLPGNLRRGSRMHALFADSVRTFVSWIAPAPGLQPLPDSPLRIFVSRGDSDASRTLINRQAIEEIAVRAGFTVVLPGKLAIVDQIRLFQGARHIVGEYGSGLHNAIFSPPGAVVCALRSTSNHPGFVQSGISQVMGQDIGYLFGAAPFDAVHQRFAVDENEFRLCLQSLELICPLPG